MASKKKQPKTFTGPRPYTGFDARGTGLTPGVAQLRDLILYLNGGKIVNLGGYMVRDMKGHPGHPSVHGTGRAQDLGYSNRADIEPLIDWLVTNADLIGLEMLADYYPQPWGRTWRCDRNAWKVYDRKQITGAPGGRWIHIEISPQLANDAAAMSAALKKVLA